MEYIWLLILSLAGLGISVYINHKKNTNSLVCIVGKHDCNEVVTSKYGTTFGFDNTILGILYFLLIFIMSIVQGFNPKLAGIEVIRWAKITFTGGGACFSVYLTFIQFAVLKKWCEYCLAGAAASILIFQVVLL